MKRITISLEGDLLVRLKLEAIQRGTTVAAVVRDALRFHLRATRIPRGTRAFRSGRKMTANRVEEELRKTGFGKE